MQKISTKLKIIILIHPLERRRKIATGRMAHLCLPNSELIEGDDFTNHVKVNQIIENPNNHSMVLYPGIDAVNLTDAKSSQSSPLLFPEGKTPVLFIIDGTWSTAKKTMKTSLNLKQLQSICFTPTAKSQFRIRKQPNDFCYSTIEAIHKVLNLVEAPLSSEQENNPHDVLLKVFLNMVEVQMDYLNRQSI